MNVPPPDAARLLAVMLEAPADAVELGQALDDGRVGELELGATAIAASAFSTLWSPGRLSVTCRSGMRTPFLRCTVKRIVPACASMLTARTIASGPKP